MSGKIQFKIVKRSDTATSSLTSSDGSEDSSRKTTGPPTKSIVTMPMSPSQSLSMPHVNDIGGKTNFVFTETSFSNSSRSFADLSARGTLSTLILQEDESEKELPFWLSPKDKNEVLLSDEEISLSSIIGSGEHEYYNVIYPKSSIRLDEIPHGIGPPGDREEGIQISPFEVMISRLSQIELEQRRDSIDSSSKVNALTVKKPSEGPSHISSPVTTSSSHTSRKNTKLCLSDDEKCLDEPHKGDKWPWQDHRRRYVIPLCCVAFTLLSTGIVLACVLPAVLDSF